MPDINRYIRLARSLHIERAAAYSDRPPQAMVITALSAGREVELGGVRLRMFDGVIHAGNGHAGADGWTTWNGSANQLMDMAASASEEELFVIVASVTVSTKPNGLEEYQHLTSAQKTMARAIEAVMLEGLDSRNDVSEWRTKSAQRRLTEIRRLDPRAAILAERIADTEVGPDGTPLRVVLAACPQPSSEVELLVADALAIAAHDPDPAPSSSPRPLR